MDIYCYPALSDDELKNARIVPDIYCRMGCHFISGGLTALPENLPRNSLLMIDDRIPLEKCNIAEVKNKLDRLTEEFRLAGILLDFQRSGSAESQALSIFLSKHMTVPVAVTEHYAQATSGPVFVCMPPAHQTIISSLEQWRGREIWLELATDRKTVIIDTEGCRVTESGDQAVITPSYCGKRYSHYKIDFQGRAARFTFNRGIEDLKKIICDKKALGIKHTVGLYQELGTHFPYYKKAADG